MSWGLRIQKKIMKKLTREQKRKRKEKRKTLAKKRRKAILERRGNKIKPWEPVKMKLFEVPNIFRNDVSREERLNVMKEIGKKAKEKFNIKYPSIQKWFKDYDALYILSFCAFYFLPYLEGTDPEADGTREIFHHYIELMQAFSLGQERNFSPKPLMKNAEVLKSDLKEIGDSMRLRDLNLPEDCKTDEDIRRFYLRTKMMAQTTAIRNWAYPDQMKRVTYDLSRLMKDEYERLSGVELERVIVMLLKLADRSEDLLNEHINKLRLFSKQSNCKEMCKSYHDVFPETTEMKDDEIDNLWDRVGHKLKQLAGILICHADLRLENIYTFSLNEAVAFYGDISKKDKIKDLLDKLSYKFGDLRDHNKEYFILDNPVHRRPFINLGEEKYYSAVFGIFPHLALDFLEDLIAENESLRKKYCDEIKPRYLEDEIERLFTLHFPSAQVYRGSQWIDPVSNIPYENDLIVLIDTFALIVEAKSGYIAPLAKRGAPHKLLETLRELIERPSEQAHRFMAYLINNKKTHIFKNKRGQENIVDSSKINYYIPLGITLAQLGSISSNLKVIIEAGVTRKSIGDLAPSISLTDIEVIFDLLPFEAEKVHYFARRREIEDHLNYEGDEIDLLSFYLDNGFNIGDTEYDGKVGLFILGKSKELDPYFNAISQGVNIPKPELNLTTWWKDILKQLYVRKPQNWVETSFILLNSTKEDQENFIRALEKLKHRIRSGSVEKKHNWVNFLSGPARRRYSIVGYPYAIENREERNNMMASILTSESKNGIRGAVVIGININRLDYPYSVLGGKLDTNLFDDLRSTENYR